jgi:hypothetical protein
MSNSSELPLLCYKISPYCVPLPFVLQNCIYNTSNRNQSLLCETKTYSDQLLSHYTYKNNGMRNRYTTLYACTHEIYPATKPCKFSIAINNLNAHDDRLKIATLRNDCGRVSMQRKVLVEEECEGVSGNGTDHTSGQGFSSGCRIAIWTRRQIRQKSRVPGLREGSLEATVHTLVGGLHGDKILLLCSRQR